MKLCEQCRSNINNGGLNIPFYPQCKIVNSQTSFIITLDESWTYEQMVLELERVVLGKAIAENNDNQSKVAAVLEMNRGTLRTKLKHHGLI